jgi:hypothetical protein
MSVPENRFDPTATALSAIANASLVPIRREDLKRILQSGDGEPSHVRTLFSDVDLNTLCRLAALFAVDDLTLARSYAAARRDVAAANAELDAFAAEFGL